jgi:hypothetical protein
MIYGLAQTAMHLFRWDVIICKLCICFLLWDLYSQWQTVHTLLSLDKHLGSIYRFLPVLRSWWAKKYSVIKELNLVLVYCHSDIFISFVELSDERWQGVSFLRHQIHVDQKYERFEVRYLCASLNKLIWSLQPTEFCLEWVNISMQFTLG